jgi:membrane protein implicated in regulation of membrane protease activity
MLMIGMTWIIIMAVLYILTIVAGVWWSAWDSVILMLPIPAPVQSYVGNTFWIQSGTYFFIIVIGLVVTYKILQATADESDYGNNEVVWAR